MVRVDSREMNNLRARDGLRRHDEDSSISKIGSLKWKERRDIEKEINSRPINSSFGKTAQGSGHAQPAVHADKD